MVEQARSLNLSNTVAIVSYEAMRQLGFGHGQERHRYQESLALQK